jgi:hypothetical protein
VVFVVAGAMAMYTAQLATQYGLRSDIRDLKTVFDAYVVQQTATTSAIEREIDEWRKESKLNRVNIEETRNELSQLRGILIGAGIKGVTK